ncbi:3-isopropylmalate dehydratase large subunit [Candidatus Bathyarchaeota archaeon]|nr:3-isopropylmalate dehydratase large subunit [Candidatus Bathyarchaeota archaeon]
MVSTITEKILAHASHQKEAVAGVFVVADVSYAMAHDSTAPLAIESFSKITDKVFDKDRVIIVFDHFFPAPTVAGATLHQKSRKFVMEQNISGFFTNGVCHQLLVEKFVSPGDVVVGADSHTCTEGALGAFTTGLGSTDIGGVMATGKCWFRVPESLKFILTGKTKKGVYAKDVILSIVGDVKADGALYKACEFTGDYVKNASVASRLTLCNMAIEMGGKNGIIEADQKTLDFLGGRTGKIFKSDKDAAYKDEFEIEVKYIEPQVALPPVVDNVEPVSAVEGKPIDQAFLGTCTNGRLEDIEVATKILKGKKIARNVRLIVTPASEAIYFAALEKGYLQDLVESGAAVCNPTCGPCVGRHGGVLAEGEVCISSQNRNFSGRMGDPKAEIILASPATVAASALAGKIVDPRGYL